MYSLTLKEFHENCLTKDIPFVSFRMPGNSEPVTFLCKDGPEYIYNDLVPTNQGLGFIVSPFRKDQPAIWIKADSVIQGYELRNFDFVIKAELSGRSEIVETLPEPVFKEEYLLQIKKIISAIKSHQSNKIVLSRNLKIIFNRTSEAPLLFSRLSKGFLNAFVYLINIPGTGCWLGATPELLLSAESDGDLSLKNDLASNDSLIIETMALAGTRPSGTIEHWNKKEIEEQEWVSMFIEEKLSLTGCELLNKSVKYTSIAGNIEHLRTDFRALISSSRFHELLNRLHPTPAVCGWPQEKALDLILKSEQFERSFYCGYLGPVDPKHKISLFVNLRCMQINATEASLYVGGGITADSDPEEEWNETTIKSRTLLSEIEKIRNLAL